MWRNGQDWNTADMVLVVHHRPALRRLLTTALAPLGEPIVTASTAEQALALLEDGKGPFSLLIAATLLPGMGGVELAQRFREHAGPLAPVILTSAYQAAPQGSCDLFFWEPFQVDEVLKGAAHLLAAAGHAR